MLPAQHKLIVLWILTVIGMILHFNYHVGDFMYGAAIPESPSSDPEPTGRIVIRTVYYLLPFWWIIVLMYSHQKGVKLLLLVISVLYALSHLGHLIGTAISDHRTISQVSLLFVVLIVAILLVKEHYNYFKQHSTNMAQTS